MIDPVQDHFGNWLSVGLWIVLYAVALLFIPFYKKSERKPATAYLAFVVAYALEMFGVPMSMYVIGWLFGRSLPDGILWGHTLNQYIGLWGMYIGMAVSLLGLLLVIVGWRTIYKQYWSKPEGQGQLVTSGVYAYIRHPQYTGFMLITLGMMFEWVTLPMLIMWPLLGILYYRLARKEERDMELEFGREYLTYKARTGMFLPRIFSASERTLARR
jgi:protein-S-isoprenylcysteine O-methyltransferase Ste14